MLFNVNRTQTTTARRRAQREAHRNSVEAAGQLDAHRTVFQGLVDSDEDDDEDESDAPSATNTANTTDNTAGSSSAERRTPTHASRGKKGRSRSPMRSPIRSPVRSPMPRSRLSAAAVAPAAAPATGLQQAAPVAIAASTDAWDDDDAASAQQRAAAQVRAQHGIWLCESCTLENVASARCCDACGLAKGEWSVAA
jgi:hypothetical protein